MTPTFNLIFNLIIAHLIGDFFLQTDKSCQKKLNNSLHNKEIYLHTIIIFILSWLVVWNTKFWWGALIIAGAHFIIDIIKTTSENKIHIQKKPLKDSRFTLIPFVIDQILHLAIIIIVSYLWIRHNTWQQFPFINENNINLILLLFMILLICSKPANILIKEILKFCQVNYTSEDKKDDETFKSGSLIGILERALIIVFIYLQQYGAIGFLIAAKSILRFKVANEGEKSEYVLTGTLLSLTIACFCGWLIPIIASFLY